MEKEKAKELIEWFLPIVNGYTSFGLFNKDKNLENAKNCAIKLCDEVIKQWEYIDTHIADMGGKLNPNLKFWLNVKKEIENYGN